MCKVKDVPLSYMFHEVYKLFHQSVKKEADLLGINPTYRFVFMALVSNKDGVTQSEIYQIPLHQNLKGFKNARKYMNNNLFDQTDLLVP